MLVFEHNQHQVDEAEQLAKELGFKWFRAKVSKRFDYHPVEFLQKPKGWNDPVVDQGHIECQALRDQGRYISAQGNIYPCCWLGANTNYTIDQFDQIQTSWTTTPNSICAKVCTKNVLGTSFSNQWQRETELHV